MNVASKVILAFVIIIGWVRCIHWGSCVTLIQLRYLTVVKIIYFKGICSVIVWHW